MALRLKEKVEIPGPKAVQRSFVKDPKEKLALHRLRVLELSKELGSVAEACRRSGMDRTSFFEWRRRYQTHGLERSNPCFRERHVESSRPGELVCLDTFYVGLFKGVGRVYMSSAVDTFGSYAFACLATDRTARRAAGLLWGQVVPFYEAHGLGLG